MLDAAAQARAEAIGDDPAARAVTEQRLGTAIGGVIGIAEAYPDLRASERFAQLQTRPDAERGPHRAGAHGLQRHGADLQRLHRAIAREPPRGRARISPARSLRARGRPRVRRPRGSRWRSSSRSRCPPRRIADKSYTPAAGRRHRDARAQRRGARARGHHVQLLGNLHRRLPRHSAGLGRGRRRSAGQRGRPALFAGRQHDARQQRRGRALWRRAPATGPAHRLALRAERR